MDHPTPARRHGLVLYLLLLMLGTAMAQEHGNGPSATPVGSLSEAWEAVLANPAMRLSEAGLQAAAARTAASDAALDMSLSLGLRGDAGAIHPEGADPDHRDPELRLDPITLSLRFDAWPGGPRAAEREVGALRLAAQRQQLFETAGQALIETTELYLAAWRAEQAVELQLLRAEQAADGLAAVLLRIDLGSATEREGREAELSLLQAEVELESAERQARQAREALERLLDRPVGRLVDPSLRSEPPVLPDDPLAALEARAVLRQARAQALEAEHTAETVRRSSGPQLNWQLSASAGDQDRRFDLGFAGNNVDPRLNLDLGFAPQTGMTALQTIGDGRAWQAGAGVSLAIPLGPQGGHQREAAALDLLAAELQAAEVTEDLLLELRDRLRAVEDAEGRLRLSEATLAARQADADDEEQRVQLGLATPTSLRDSRLAVEAALSDLHRAGDGLVLAHMRLALSLAIDPLEVLR